MAIGYLYGLAIFILLIRAPEISHSAKKKTKSEVCILSLSLEDPSSNEGMIKISEALMPYLPQYPSGKNQKMALFGDQGYVERGT